MGLPSVFLGSSTEGKSVARALQLLLRSDASVALWDTDVFALNKSFLESLEAELSKHDFAIFVLSADDVSLHRGTESATPRDNVLFELGLFMGRLGRSRTFIVAPTNVDMRMMSDLAGITVAGYLYPDAHRPDFNRQLDAALGPACEQIRRVLTEKAALNQSLPALMDDQQVVFLLRHLDSSPRAVPLTECAWIMYGYDSPGEQYMDSQSAGWLRAAQYAIGFLCQRQWVTSDATGAWIASPARDFLRLASTRDKYLDVLSRPLVSDARNSEGERAVFERVFGALVLREGLTTVFPSASPAVSNGVVTGVEYHLPPKEAGNSQAKGIEYVVPFEDMRASNAIAEMCQVMGVAHHVELDRAYADDSALLPRRPLVSLGLGFNNVTTRLSKLSGAFGIIYEDGSDNFVIDARHHGFPKDGLDCALVARIVVGEAGTRVPHHVCAGRTAAGTLAAGLFIARRWPEIATAYVRAGRDIHRDSIAMVISFKVGAVGKCQIVGEPHFEGPDW